MNHMFKKVAAVTIAGLALVGCGSEGEPETLGERATAVQERISRLQALMAEHETAVLGASDRAALPKLEADHLTVFMAETDAMVEELDAMGVCMGDDMMGTSAMGEMMGEMASASHEHESAMGETADMEAGEMEETGHQAEMGEMMASMSTMMGEMMMMGDGSGAMECEDDGSGMSGGGMTGGMNGGGM